MEKQRIRKLMVKKISATATQEELQELAVLFNKFPEYKLIDELMSNIKTNMDGTPGEEEIEVQLDALWKKINTHQESPLPTVNRKSLFGYKSWLAAAAVFIAVLIAGMLAYQKDSVMEQDPGKYRVITAAYGHTSRVVLPDGSIVKMNSGTTLSYPVEFSANVRQVKLVGEAFFEVTKNPNRPFMVHAGNLTVRVLGTSFNVKAYQEDNNVETTLIHGKVQVVMDNEPDKLITLSPNEKLTVAKRAGNTKIAHLPGELKYKLQTVAVKPTDNIEEIAWLERKFAFNNTSFEDVAKIIERKYNVKLVFEQEQLKSELITGVFENEELSRALNLLHMSTSFNYEIKKDTVILSSSKNSKQQ